MPSQHASLAAVEGHSWGAFFIRHPRRATSAWYFLLYVIRSLCAFSKAITTGVLRDGLPSMRRYNDFPRVKRKQAMQGCNHAEGRAQRSGPHYRQKWALKGVQPIPPFADADNVILLAPRVGRNRRILLLYAPLRHP